MLNKIKFLISNKYINSYEYQVSTEEELLYENTNSYNKPKVRRLIKPPTHDDAAFVKSSFLIIAIAMFSIFLATIIILNK